MIHNSPDPQKAFLGVGWSFQVRLDPDGTLAESVYEQDIREAIIIILGTNPSERVMRPDFGAGLNAFVFEPINTTTMSLIQTRVRQALIKWEARIDVQTVDVAPASDVPSKLLIEIDYRIRATNAVGNLVYPFYLQEGNPA
jgi:uncharacterized protein